MKTTNPPRRDGELFDSDYLLGSNRDVADSVLWPVPVLHQSTLESIDVGATTVTPGDVLELIDEDREEFVLVVAILAGPSSCGSEQSGPTLLGYSSNRECYIDISGSSCWSPQTPETETTAPSNENRVAVDDSTYVVHNGVVDPVEDDPVASVSFVQDSPAAGDYSVTRPSGYYPYSSPPTPMSPSYPAGTYSVPTDDVLDNGAFRDEFFVGDAKAVLRQFPTASLHGWVTSPPYPNTQRDYDIDGQLGFEQTPAEYLEGLLGVVLQAMRVTRDDGTGWLVLDDTIIDGEFVAVPDRLVAQLKEEGFKIIHNGPWVKSATKPDPAPKRFAHSHERIIGIAKESGYHFNRRAVENPCDVIELPTHAQSEFKQPSSDISHDAMFSVELASHLIRTAIPTHTCPTCDAPMTPNFEVTDILDLEENRHKNRVLAAFHRTPEMTRDHARACRALGLGDTGQSARTQSGTGRNSTEVEQLIEEVRASSFPNSYIREFSYARKRLTGYEPSCEHSDFDQHDCTGGTVLDPFLGSGTTAVAALRHGRHYTGIDLNPEYVELATDRVSTGITASLSNF